MQRRDTTAIRTAVEHRRWETARRLCLAAMDERPTDRELLLLMHRISPSAGDVAGCERILSSLTPTSDAERLEQLLLRAEDLKLFAREQFYRTSREKDAGLTFDEYRSKLESERERLLSSQTASVRAEDLPSSRDAARSGIPGTPIARDGADRHDMVLPSPLRENGVVGRIQFLDGSPAAGVTVTLGLSGGTTITDSCGDYTLAAPAGEYEFLAVTLDGREHEIVTRYVAHGVTIPADGEATLNITVRDWQSAPALPTDDPPAGAAWARHLRNPFDYDFPRQVVAVPMPPGAYITIHGDPVQMCGDHAVFFADLPAGAQKMLALLPGEVPSPPSMLQLAEDVAVIDTGPAQFRIPWLASGAPLLAVRGTDRQWRGHGRMVLPDGVAVKTQKTTLLDDGPVLLRVAVDFVLSNGSRLAYVLTAHRGEPYLLVHETSAPLEGAAFEFSLREFSSGRGYLHWKASEGSQDWSTLTAEDRELARLQESVPWWIPPCGFGYGMTPDGLAEQDFVGVFTIRRGEWIDRAFAAVAAGPGDEPAWRRELEWPYPEMVGSTVSMITANTTRGGDAAFRFKLFDGERHWGIGVSTLAENDGPAKKISEFQHKNSSPTLQQFMGWHLDEPDAVQRPHVVARREDLPLLRARRTSPTFGPFWQRIPEGALRFAVEGDPALGWRMKQDLLADARRRSRATLLCRDFGDSYSPVGGRPITRHAEEYDLLAASCVFTADEEREIRAYFILMGHLFMSPDLMNWKLGSRNANFEADRVDVVGTIGVAFAGHSDSQTFTDHAIELMERSINTYCTPGSGKWYENPACYYLQASKCRLNLLFHLATAGLFEPTSMPRLRDFLRWGILLLTPPTPHDYHLMRDGCDDAGYAATAKVRRLPPIGDHAMIGPWVPDHYALAAKLYRPSDPAFADELLWAYQAGGANGGYFGNLPLLFARLEDADLSPAPPPALESRRLEGFGAVFRHRFGQTDESYLLMKQGPGGYRYHRSEGSILFFADGKPLIYDGGEAGETWRHSTLSFYDVHMPLSPGHVTRFETTDLVDFCRGVHPLALIPGQPTFLNDVCDIGLIAEALRRYHEPNPANVRSVWWVKDEYLVLIDELAIDPVVPCHWHLQVVADSHNGDWRSGYRFAGRFGTDLQVLLPGQAFVDEAVTQDPILEYRRTPAESFSMRHLRLRADRPRRYIAILRPLRPGQPSLTARLDGNSLRIHGPGIDDRFDFDRDTRTYHAVLQRNGNAISFDFSGA